MLPPPARPRGGLCVRLFLIKAGLSWKNSSRDFKAPAATAEDQLLQKMRNTHREKNVLLMAWSFVHS